MAAVVVLFNPDLKEVEQNVLSYLSEVDRLYCVDNTNGWQKGNSWLFDGTNPKVQYIQNGKNLGIAAALNIGYKEALKDDFNWVLTMDQDSSFTVDAIKLYMNHFKNNLANADNCIFCPVTKEFNVGDMEVFGAHSITSGSICNLNLYSQVGGFDEKLFIDEVDADFSLKAEIAGFKVLKFTDVFLNHKLGTKRRSGLFNLFFLRERTIHSPFRVYFMVRNYLYVRKKYRSYFPAMFKKRDQDFLIMLKNNLLFSGTTFPSAIKALKGFLDYKLNRF